jgi:hypothetical protein
MCRNIRKLRHPEAPPSDAELSDAALQFVRKISGYHTPSERNRKAFDRAVREITRASRGLFDRLEAARAPARDSAA